MGRGRLPHKPKDMDLVEYMEPQLTEKEVAFCESYIQNFNPERACREAGYDFKSKQGFRTNGALILKRPLVAKYIAEVLRSQHMSADEVVTRLTEQARGSYAEYLQADGTVNLDKLLANGKGHLIKKITPTKYGLAVEFYDMQAAQQLIGRAHRLFVDKVDQVSEVTLKVEYGELPEGEGEDLPANAILALPEPSEE